MCTYTIIRAPKSPFPNPLAAKVERKDTQINAARKQQSEFISHGLPLSKVLEKVGDQFLSGFLQTHWSIGSSGTLVSPVG